MGLFECRAVIMDHYKGLDLTFVDEGEPTIFAIKAPQLNLFLA